MKLNEKIFGQVFLDDEQTSQDARFYNFYEIFDDKIYMCEHLKEELQKAVKNMLEIVNEESEDFKKVVNAKAEVITINKKITEVFAYFKVLTQKMFEIAKNEKDNAELLQDLKELIEAAKECIKEIEQIKKEYEHELYGSDEDETQDVDLTQYNIYEVNEDEY